MARLYMASGRSSGILHYSSTVSHQRVPACGACMSSASPIIGVATGTDIDADATVTVTGSVTIHWLNLGDA